MKTLVEKLNESTKFEIIPTKEDQKVHLTALDKNLIKASLEAGVQDVGTKKKMLKINSNVDGIVDATIHTYEQGIGLGSGYRWNPRKIRFKLK